MFRTWMIPAATVVATLCVLSLPLAAQTDATWNGGDGQFNDAGKWSGGVVPDGVDFNALIDGGNNVSSNVGTANDESFEIGSLTVDAGDSLSLGSEGNVEIKLLTDTNLNPDSGRIENNGLIVIGGSGGNRISIDSEVTLSGGGTIRLTGNHIDGLLSGHIRGTGQASHLINAGSTIEGSGGLGGFSLQITNQAGSLIHANVPDTSPDDGQEGLENVLVVTGSHATRIVTNEGVLRASNGGRLLLGGEVRNTGGIIEAIDDATVFDYGVGVNIIGGTLRTSSNGKIDLMVESSLTDLIIDGTVNVLDETALAGQIDNQGLINIGGPGGFPSSSPVLTTTDSVTLGGAGTVQLNGIETRILVEDAHQIVNLNNTVQGFGQILVNDGQANNVLGIVNGDSGVIQANVDGKVLRLNSENFSEMANQGTLSANNGGTLAIGAYEDLNANHGLYVDNARGNIVANDGSTVSIALAEVDGGSLRTIGSGLIKTDSNVYLNDLQLEGNLENNGKIFLDTVQNAPYLPITIAGEVSLSGGGEVDLHANTINGVSTEQSILTNIDNTIEGAGQIGNGNLTFINRFGGTVVSSDGNSTLVIDADVTNEGTLSGDGTIEFAQTLINQGKVAPGNSVGELTIFGSMEFGESAILDIEIDSSGADLVTVFNGDVELNGSLEISMLDSFVPDATDEFEIMQVVPTTTHQGPGTLTGMFIGIGNGDTVSIIGGSGSFDVHYNYTTGRVWLSNFAVAVPEPSGGFILTALAVSTAFRRRRHAA